MPSVDLNADMGESFGPWVMGNDAAILDIVTSANIACGFHAGDPDVMAKTMRMALDRGVGLGAHPGFADVQGFGRRRIKLSSEELSNMVAYQLGAAQAMARAAGGELRHLKLHGAMANMASEDIEMARICYAAAEKDATKLLETGEVPRDKSLDPTSHAAWTQLSATLLASDLALMMF